MLPSLALYPDCQGLIQLVIGWHPAVSVGCLKRKKLIEFLLPSRRVRVPNEAKSVESLLAICCDGGVFPLLLQSVLVSLTFDPLCQPGILMPIVWNHAVSTFLVEIYQLLISLIPLSLLALSETASWGS